MLHERKREVNKIF